MPFKRALTYSIIINLFFLALGLIFGDLKFGAVDDYFMAARLTGALGTEYNPHLIFVNAIYGYALLPLYHLFPTIGWYYIGEMAAVFISFVTIGYVLLQRCGERWGAILAALFTALFASDFYLVLQFTQCASILSAAGMLLFAYGVLSLKSTTDRVPLTSARLSELGARNNIKFNIQSTLPFILGVALMLWGSVMRWQAFLMGMPFFCLGLLFIIRSCWKAKIHVLASLTILFAAAFAIHNWDQNIYKAPEYEAFNKFQGPRVALGDNSNYNQNAVLEDAEELGLSFKDYLMLTGWVHYDTEVFSVDSLKRYTDIIAPYRDTNPLEFIPRHLFSALSNALHSPLFWTWFIMCLLVYITNRKKSIYVWVSLFIILALMAQLLAIGRLVYRVESGFWLYAAVLAIPLIGKVNVSIPHKLVYTILSVIALVNTITYANSGNIVRNPVNGEKRTIAVEDSTDYQQVFNYIDNNPDKMFLLSMNAFMRFSHHRNPPYLAEPIGTYRRTISFGYWTPYLPEVTKALADFNISNPIRDVVQNNVIVLNEPGLIDFLQRHYYNKVELDTLAKFGDMTFYKYHIAQDADTLSKEAE